MMEDKPQRMGIEARAEITRLNALVATVQIKNTLLQELIMRGINLPPSEYDYQWRMDAKAALKSAETVKGK